MVLAAHRITPALGEAPTTPTVAYQNDVVGHVPRHAFFDLVVIGSGPAALTLVTRILESRPAAIYTEDEHHHLHWLHRQQSGLAMAPLLKTTPSGRGNERVIAGTKEQGQHGTRLAPVSILVLDKLGDGWLGMWNRLFRAYEILHLRSPMFFHPEPSDLGSLLEYAVKNNRAQVGHPSLMYQKPKPRRGRRAEMEAEAAANLPDLLEIPGVVGKEVSKHKKKQLRSRRYASSAGTMGPAVNERDRKDYATPSSALFRDFVEELVQRYNLEPPRDAQGNMFSVRSWIDLVGTGQVDDPVVCPQCPPHGAASTGMHARLVRGDVTDMDYGTVQVGSGPDTEAHEGFSLHTADGTVLGARAVVSAVGTGGRPQIPEWLLGRQNPRKPAPTPPTNRGPGWAHSSAFAAPDFQFPMPEVQKRLDAGQHTTLVVIGGGLTSAQICDMAVRRGFQRVILLMRGFMKVKPFDIGLEWLGKYANICKMQFWQCPDPATRRQMLLDARQGGSITPPYAKLMQRYAAEGRIEIRTHTEVTRARWDTIASQWTLDMTRRGDCPADTHETNNPQAPGTTETVTAEYVVSCTGAQLGFSTLPFMRSIAPKIPIAQEGGLPVLTEDLQYGSIPLFCVGPYSALQVGPAAFNLGGMREAADRVAMRLGELFEQSIPETEPEQERAQAKPGAACPDSPAQFRHFGYHLLVEEVE